MAKPTVPQKSDSPAAETIEALTAKCALLSASLKQAEAEAREGIRKAGGELDDCAGMLDCYASWHLALFRAIERYSDDPRHRGEVLDVGTRHNIAQLASIGAYLADQAYSEAHGYNQKAKAIRGAA